MTWQYRTETLKATGFTGGHVDTTDMDQLLNNLGHEGWELVNSFATQASNGHTRLVVFVFKRPTA